MRVICVTGSRSWSDSKTIRNVLSGLQAEGYDTLIHGGAPGADAIAALVAAELGYKVVAFPAEWDKWGSAAGPLRNSKMLKEGKPDLVIAFPTDDSVGTWDTVNKAKKMGITVQIYQFIPDTGTKP